MRALVQRVSQGSVTIDGRLHSSIGPGLVVLLGIARTDDSGAAQYLANRCLDLRIFEDEAGKMNKSLKDISGEMLVISQFTLYGDTRKGNRPSFVDAAPPEIAGPLYEQFLAACRTSYSPEKIHSGVFRAMMDIALINQGPVTVMIESK